MSVAQWRDLTEQLLFEGLLREDPNDGRPLVGRRCEMRCALFRGERKVACASRPRATTETRSGRPRKRRETIALTP
jgi:ATP-dependent DNA helicase RecQ